MSATSRMGRLIPSRASSNASPRSESKEHRVQTLVPRQDLMRFHARAPTRPSSTESRRFNRRSRRSSPRSGIATNRKGSRLQSRYHALRARCGNKRAIVALGHMLLKIVHAVLSARLPYREDPLASESSRNEERARHHIRCLKKLGYNTFAAE